MSVLEMKEGNIARLTITVEKDAFVKALNDAYHKTAGRYPVPGFRKGKAPPQGHRNELRRHGLL